MIYLLGNTPSKRKLLLGMTVAAILLTTLMMMHCHQAVANHDASHTSRDLLYAGTNASSSRYANDKHGNGSHSDGSHSDGNHSDGSHSDGNHSDGSHGDALPFDPSRERTSRGIDSGSDARHNAFLSLQHGTPVNVSAFLGRRPSDILDMQIDDMSVQALPYLDNFRNPCWREDLPSDSPYMRNFFLRTGRDVYNKYFKPWKLTTKQRYKDGVRERLRCLPLVYQVGIAKAGTTDLYFSLAQHPLIHTGGYKEPHYWSLFRFRGWKPSLNEVNVPLRDYLDLYDKAAMEIEEQVEGNSSYHPGVTIDASVYPVYDFRLWEFLPPNKGLDEPRATAAHYLKMLVPNAKIIVSVREPVSRLLSHFYHFTDRRRATPKLFHEASVSAVANMERCFEKHTVRYCIYHGQQVGDHLKLNGGNLVDLAASMYYPLLKDWHDVFGWEQLKIVRLEDHKINPEKVTSEIYDFLELPPFQIKRDVIKNKSHGHARMLPETKKLLENFYAPFNKLMADFMHDENYNYRYS